MQMYEFWHISGDTVLLDGAVAARVFQLLGDLVFAQFVGLVLLVLILGAICFGLFRAK